MKKLFSAIIAFCMIISMAVVPAFAANEGKVIISVETVEAQPGSEVEIDVNIDANGVDYTCSGMTLKLDYDKEQLTVNSVTAGALLGSVMPVLDHTTLEGSIRIGSMAATGGFSGSGTICTVKATVNENVEIGTEIALTLGYVNGADKDFVYMASGSTTSEPIPNVLVSGAVNVVAAATPAPDPTQAPETQAPATSDAPETQAPVTSDAPASQAPASQAPATAKPTTGPVPPTGAAALVGAGIAAIAAGAGIVIFRKKED